MNKFRRVIDGGGIVFKYPLVDIQRISELYEQNTRKFQKVHA